MALFVVLVAPAGADVGATIISKCTHGESIAGFSQQAYREALQELPTEVEKYSDCANLIRQAELGAAGAGGGGGTLARVSSAQIVALLASELTPTGKSAKIGALLKSGGFAMAFKALEAGTAQIAWYYLPPGAKLAKKTKANPVVAAFGGLTFAAAGAATIKIRLTTSGQNLLKHTKRLKLTAKGWFTPAGGTAATALRRFTLTR